MGITTSRPTVEELQDALGAQDTRNANEPIRAVYEITELLEMILLPLPTKDLARSLVVSKHWQRSSLTTVALRRKLFLFPDFKKEYSMYNPYAEKDDRREFSMLLRKPCSMSRPIHEPHPILLPHSDSTKVVSIEIKGVPYQALRTVDPETFLFQPPLNDVQVYYKYSVIGTIIHCKLGMTFGQLVKEIDKIRALYTDRNKDKDGTCRLRHSGAVASNADVVTKAREARARAQSDTVNG